MISEYKNFIIEVFNDETYTYGSADNDIKYKFEYLKDNSYLTSKHGIRVSMNDNEVSSAIICENGSPTGIHEKSFLIKGNSIFICCSDNIYSLDIPTLKLNWNRQFDTATCFEIHEYGEDLIIHGEMEISRITPDGIIKWQFSGRDIFVTINGEKEFELDSDFIKLTDFQGYKYVLDANGKETS